MPKKTFVDKHPVATTVLGISAISWIGWLLSKVLKVDKK